MPQGPNYGLQNGSQWVVSDEGTLTIGNGGSINVESGGVINVAAGGSFVNAGGQAFSGSVTVSGSLSVTGPLGAPNITLGGTLMRIAFGTTGIASGVGTVPTGLTRVVAANANPLLGETQGAGSAAFVFVDLSLSGAGSVIYRLGSVGGALWNANATISWQAMGT
jgi:hypothetical protein